MLYSGKNLAEINLSDLIEAVGLNSRDFIFYIIYVQYDTRAAGFTPCHYVSGSITLSRCLQMQHIL